MLKDPTNEYGSPMQNSVKPPSGFGKTAVVIVLVLAALYYWRNK